MMQDISFALLFKSVNEKINSIKVRIRYYAASHTCKSINLLLVSVKKHTCKSFERLFNMFALHCAYLKEFKTNLVRESLAIMSVNLLSAFKICFVCNYNSCKLFTTILSFNLVVPGSK